MLRKPKSVPVLTAGKICKGMFDGPRETHCLAGWCQAAGLVKHRGAVNDDAEPKMTRAILGSAEKLGAFSGNRSISSVNDDPGNPKALVARIWNLAMKKLGYVRRGKVFVLPKRKVARP